MRGKKKGACFGKAVAMLVGMLVLPSASHAYCVYNDTSHVVRASAPSSCGGFLCGDFDQWIAPGGSACCNFADEGCNEGGAPDRIRNIVMTSEEIIRAVLDLPQKSTGLECVVPIRADGYAVIGERSRRHLGVGQNALVCEGFDVHLGSPQLRFRTPPGIGDDERDVHFLVTADPQYDNGNASYRNEANKVMRTLTSRIEDHHFEAPGYASEKIQGVLVAGDLTQNSRKDEWDDYTGAMGGYHRFFYDGLGNHDIIPSEWGEDLQCSFGLDGCVLPDTIYRDVLLRNRGSVLSVRGHFWDPEKSIGSSFNVSPHYSWDWHDVHFVQLNLVPADFPVAKAAYDPPGSVAFDEEKPFQGLAFLKRDLELIVGATGRPVVLIHHYGFDRFSTGQSSKGELWWSWAQRLAYWDVIKDYNVIAIFTGHVHYDSSTAFSTSDKFEDPCSDPATPCGGPLPPEPRRRIPTFVAGAARGSNDSTPLGTYLDVRIAEDQMVVRKMDADGNQKFQRLIDRSPAGIRVPGGTSSSYTMPTFTNPNTGAVGLQQFSIEHAGDWNLGGTPLRVEKIVPQSPAPWLSVSANGFRVDGQPTLSGAPNPIVPFSVPVGGSQVVEVLVEYRLAPEGFSTQTLLVYSNAPTSASGPDFSVTVNINNLVSCSPPPPPTLLAPANGSTTFDTTPTFSWQAAPNANAYRIQAQRSDTGGVAFGPQLTAATSFTPGTALATGPYVWTVEGHNTTGGCNIFGLGATGHVTVGQPRLYIDTRGLGTVTSTPPGINCGATCSASFPVGQQVGLQAVAFAGSATVGATTFAGWSGDADCSDGTVILGGTTFCTATFDSTQAILTIQKTGTGSGRVLSDPPGIDCGADCSETYVFGSDPLVKLTPLPDEGSVFAFWLGCSDGSTVVDSDQTCTAVFRDAQEEVELTVTVSGGGIYTVSPASGSVMSDVPGIDCGSDCTERYKVGTIVTLEPVPGPGSVFRDWSGGDASCEGGIVGSAKVVGNGTDTICRANFGPTLLLVDDDDNGPNVLPFYADALDALGVPYDVWDTERGDKEPEAPVLGAYSRVIWFSGFADGFAGPGDVGESHLAPYLSSGGCLLLSSQDYHTYRGLTPFMATYLGVADAADDVNHSQVTGVGPVFGGLGPYSLSFPFDNHSDSVSPTADSKLAFSGPLGDAGVQRDSGYYRTMYLGFPLESLPTVEAGQAVLSRFLDFCAAPRPFFEDDFESGDTSAWASSTGGP